MALLGARGEQSDESRPHVYLTTEPLHKALANQMSPIATVMTNTW